jgi:uncharacterized protein
MKIQLDKLEATPSAHPFDASPAWWQEQVVDRRNLDCVLDEPFHFDTEAYKLATDVFLAGTFRGSIGVECGRCLQRYRHALSEGFRLVLEPAGERQPPDPEGVLALERDGLCLAEELELGWYRGQKICLDAFFSELIALALPLQPVCREGCRGLCPHCGVDRNQTGCDCEEEKRPPSPFAVLASLRTEPDAGEGG